MLISYGYNSIRHTCTCTAIYQCYKAKHHFVLFEFKSTKRLFYSSFTNLLCSTKLYKDCVFLSQATDQPSIY